MVKETTGDAAGDVPPAVPNAGQADFATAAALKFPLISQAVDKLLSDAAFSDLRAEVAAFRAANPWVEESALFDSLRRSGGREEVDWWNWEAPLRDRDAATIAAKREEFKGEMDKFIATQMLFDKQWGAVKVRAAAWQTPGELCFGVVFMTFWLYCGGAPSRCGLPPDIPLVNCVLLLFS